MTDRLPWWVWPHLLALDAPLVAVLWQRFLASAFGVILPAAPSVCLGLVVWGVYLLDRGLDARPNRPVNPAARHEFARKNRLPMTICGSVCLLAGAVVALTCLPVTSLIDGAIVGAALAAYLAIVHFTRRGLAHTKELAVALVFAGGVGIPLAARAPDRVELWWPAVAGFAGVCFLNCLLIDRWEHPRAGVRLWAAVATVGCIVAAVCSPEMITVALLGAVGLLAVLHRFHHRIGPQATRVLADVVLLTPLLVWWA